LQRKFDPVTVPRLGIHRKFIIPSANDHVRFSAGLLAHGEMALLVP